MRITTHKIERKRKSNYKTTFGFYTFNKCTCGCTKCKGFGFQLVFFGFAVHLK